jgi:hypothetical protein
MGYVAIILLSAACYASCAMFSFLTWGALLQAKALSDVADHLGVCKSMAEAWFFLFLAIAAWMLA